MEFGLPAEVEDIFSVIIHINYTDHPFNDPPGE